MIVIQFMMSLTYGVCVYVTVFHTFIYNIFSVIPEYIIKTHQLFCMVTTW